MKNKNKALSRRDFIKMGGPVLAGTALISSSKKEKAVESEDESSNKIKNYRKLGRIDFKASDISMGCGRINEANVVRYAYDNGINYFDVAESYGNGDSETKIGEVMQFMERKKIFITTKLQIKENDTKQSILDRFGKCQERMQTDYVDALYMHSVKNVDWFKNEHFHSAVKQLKQEGRLKHVGISSHGPNSDDQDSMEKVLCAAAEDGRFDLMLFVYNFLQKEAGENILAACKKTNVGATGMKMAPGAIKVDPFDPENPSKEYADYIDRALKRGRTREWAIERIKNWIIEQKEALDKTKPFAEKYGITTDDQLFNVSNQWVIQNPDMHTICISIPDFETADKAIALSGTKLTIIDTGFLNEYKINFDNQYCRHACNECMAACPEKLPVSSIMRYAYYFEKQGREKHAMQKYANLKGKDFSKCKTCSEICTATCPYGLDIQKQLMFAHSRLTFA